MKTSQEYTNEEILNQGCYVMFEEVEFYCYNVTSLMHFVKTGKKGQKLTPNKSNVLNLKKDQVLTLVSLKAAIITVGSI